MLKMRLLGLLLVCPLFLFSQTVVDSMDHGDNSIEWRVFETEGPVAAFGVSPKQVWYSNGATVGVYDRRTNKKRLYPKLGDTPAQGIVAIETDNQGGVWFGGNQGAILFKNNAFTLFTSGNGLPDNAVNKIVYGGGAVWIGTQNGLAQYKGGSWKVFTTAEGLPSNKITAIAPTDGKEVYFGTDKGVVLYNGSGYKVFTAKDGLSWNNVTALGFDARKEQLWAAVGEQDVNMYDGKEWNTYMDICPGIASILTDTQSRIWFGSPTGIIKYNGFEWVTDPTKIGFPAANVSHMYRDEKGDLYFGLESGVLHMKNPYPF